MGDMDEMLRYVDHEGQTWVLIRESIPHLVARWEPVVVQEEPPLS